MSPDQVATTAIEPVGPQAAVAQVQSIRAFVAIEGDTVYVFPSRKALKEYDLRTCTTAVAPTPGQFRKLVKASTRKRRLKLKLRVHPNYFHDFSWSYNMIGHYRFGTIPLNPICESRNLYEILRVSGHYVQPVK